MHWLPSLKRPSEYDAPVPDEGSLGGDTSGAGVAVEGTVVVTPGLEIDIAAALEGASVPGSGNPYVTLDDIGGGARIEAKEGEIVRASVETFASGLVEIEVFDELGVLAYSIKLDTTEFTISNVDSSRGFAIAAGGSVSLNSDGAEYRIGADGGLTMRNADASGTLAIDAAGAIDVSGSPTRLYAPIRVSGLPTADPVAAGELWSDSGTVKVSAG